MEDLWRLLSVAQLNTRPKILLYHPKEVSAKSLKRAWREAVVSNGLRSPPVNTRTWSGRRRKDKREYSLCVILTTACGERTLRRSGQLAFSGALRCACCPVRPETPLSVNVLAGLAAVPRNPDSPRGNGAKQRRVLLAYSDPPMALAERAPTRPGLGEEVHTVSDAGFAALCRCKGALWCPASLMTRCGKQRRMLLPCVPLEEKCWSTMARALNARVFFRGRS